MNDVEEQILSYPHLSAEEKREVEAYVESNPEWSALLQDVRSLERLSSDMRPDLPSDALLATYVRVQHLQSEVPPRLQTAFAELEARLEENADLRREVETARRRLEEAEAVVDPVSHFETLTGHSLEEKTEEHEETTDSEAREDRSTVPSVIEVFLELPRLVRRGAVVVVLLAGLYGGLYGVSRATQSTLDRLATIEVSSQVVENYATTDLRSPRPGTGTLSVDDQYLKALSALRGAQRSTLGLFPRYNAETLTQAERQLKRVLEQVKPRSFLALEARFYLGKIALAQNEVDAARAHFKAVVKGEGRKAQEAHRILKILQREYGMGNGRSPRSRGHGRGPVTESPVFGTENVEPKGPIAQR
ncbi:MAG: hypothetical protein ABEK84_05055 [Salinibacter sp.]